ncbi:hypothetical protein [Pectinatus brassicae]|uniref:Uncharacterized protein n=1 Tax=Pectinatus brassicae TaxID=862415 RepID=A0A840UTL7_9FIRM|nr:hypothetical protein [Pectinatus brassicae]MBB5336164.1 hypothetical protein [Pectinatus brassicae]
MKKVSVFLILFYSFLYIYQSSCEAMHIISSQQIASFNTSDLWGDVKGIRTTGQWGRYVRFRFYMPSDYSGKISGELLVNGESQNLHFSFVPGSTIKIFEFKASDPNMTFWILKDNSVNEKGLTHDFYLIGPYKERYVTFVTMDTLVKNMSWSSVNMKVRQLATDEAWPILQGYSDNGDILALTENLVLSWDNNAEWFKMETYPLDTLIRNSIYNE